MKENNVIIEEKNLIEEQSYNKELNCKKNILEYIELLKEQDKEALTKESWQERYNMIYSQIEALSSQIKPNTVVQLKNALKAGIGKRVTTLDPVQQSSFVEFFKQAYPEGKRRKDFTWVLADSSKISDEQILHTLKYISNWCMKNKLDAKQKEDIKVMLVKLTNKGNLKYINQVKSLEGLRKNRALDEYIKNIGTNTKKKPKQEHGLKINKR